jgi:G3E family GTPase
MTQSNKIPVTIFTGFLGAGKTTLVNTLLKLHEGRKVGVIVNEFGAVGVDSDLIESNEELKVEISNGCVCCVVRGDLEVGVEKLLKDYPDLDNIFVEASGLAEPLPIIQTFVHNLALDKRSYLDAVICLVDGQNFISGWDQFETLRQQLEYCDFIVLTKVNEDKDQASKTRAAVEKIRPDSAILEFNPDSPENIKILLDSHSFDLTEELEQKMKQEEEHDHEHDHHSHKPHEDHGHHHHDQFDEVVFSSQKPLDADKLDQVFQTEDFRKLLRAKGFLNFSMKPDQTFVFQLVGHSRQLTPYNKTKDTSMLVLIGPKLNKQKLLDELANCLVEA